MRHALGRLPGMAAMMMGTIAGAAMASTVAQTAGPPAATPSTPVASTPPATDANWTALLDGLRDLPEKILAKLPPEQRDDPHIRAEANRLALSALTGAAIDALASDADHPVFVPQINVYLTIGQPNADTNYRSATITPGGTYRLRGRRGSMRMVRIAESGPRPPQTGGTVNLGPPRPVHDLNALKADAQGRYDVILSPKRPDGYAGDWWPLDPTTNRLLVRMVGSDWGKEVEPTLSIERIDIPAPRPRLLPDLLAARLKALPAAATFIAPLLAGQPGKLRNQGPVNTLRAADFSTQGGLTGQFYYEGAYALKDDEALIVEAPLPARCLYRSLLLTNDLYETTDWYNNQSSLNDAQASADRDGILRIVVSAKDPGVPNWLDTAGHATGVIQGRWTECSAQPVPTIRKVALADVRKSLPSGTPTISPQARDRVIRDRRAALQQRPLW
jgi:hypothetical protein